MYVFLNDKSKTIEPRAIIVSIQW